MRRGGDLVFYPETREILVHCIRILFENEREIEQMRIDLYNSFPRFDHYQCFKLIDIKADGALDCYEVRAL